MKHTSRRAACAAALIVLATLLGRAETRTDAETRSGSGDPPGAIEPEFDRVRLAESIVRSERSAVLLGELLAAEAVPAKEGR